MSWWLRHIGWWPPLLGAGIKLTRLDKDLRQADVEMRLTRWNKNYVGVHFGGSLFRLTEEKLAEIRAAVEADGRYDVRFLIEIKDEEGVVVAVVERVIYCATKTAHEERAKLRSGTG